MTYKALQTLSSISGHTWLGLGGYLAPLTQVSLRCGVGGCQHPAPRCVTACQKLTLWVPLTGCNQEAHGLALADVIKGVIVTFPACLNR